LSSTASRLESNQTPASGHPQQPRSWMEPLKHCSGCPRQWRRMLLSLGSAAAREGGLAWRRSMAMEGGPDGLAVPQYGYMEEEPLWRLWWRRSHECATEEGVLDGQQDM
jgi:hypothetical protein